jgi:hypothetical protein
MNNQIQIIADKIQVITYDSPDEFAVKIKTGKHSLAGLIRLMAELKPDTVYSVTIDEAK